LAGGLVFAGGKKEPPKPTPKPQSTASQSQVATPQVTVPAATKRTNPYFDGDGGTGITLAVLEPTGVGLSAGEQWMLPLVQGSLTGDLAKYSGMTILDRQNLDKILAEQRLSASGDFSDEDYIRMGELVNARYILTGSITKTPSGYVLELAVSESETGIRKASYPPKPVSAITLENLAAVKEASANLLEQLGVSLTGRGKTELAETANTASINAETALSKAITAQKNGTVVEALAYYYQAVNYDSSLAEAASRLNVLQANVSSGNIGSDTRNDIRWRRDWVARLTEAEQYYANYTKETVPYYLVYSTNLQQGTIDYAKETVTISGCTINLLPNAAWFETIGRVINLVRDGLMKTGRTTEWGLDWPYKSIAQVSPFQNHPEQFTVDAELVNDQGVTIGKQRIPLQGGWAAETGVRGYLRLMPQVDKPTEVVFSNVNANLITDRLTIKIAGINGGDVEATAKTKRISILTEAEYSTLPEVIAGTDSRNIARLVSLFDINISGVLTRYRGDSKDIIIPGSIFGHPITAIGKEAFSGSHLTSVTIPDSVTSIGEKAFYYHRLTSVTIPASVTSIGHWAFECSLHYLSSVTILGNVTDTERYPFDGLLYQGPGMYTRKKRQGARTDWDHWTYTPK
jgi:hypothetical protein